MAHCEFEAHLTVSCDGDPHTAARLVEWCAPRCLKCTHIVLARGRTPSQPMVTLHGRGTREEQFTVCGRVAEQLRAAEFDVVRVKIEVAADAWMVPRTDAEALRRTDGGTRDGTPGAYFEHHLKVLLPPARHAPDEAPGSVVARLTETATAHHAHLSRNARRRNTATGQEQRFVTQRRGRVGLDTARAAADALRSAIEELDIPVLEEEREYVIHDSDLGVDEGWILPAVTKADRTTEAMAR